MTEELAILRSKAAQIHERLIEAYGTPCWTKIDGVSELVSTILSQNTNDGNRDLAYVRLRARFPTWEQVRDADAESVVDAIRPAGLSNQKGPRIQAALRRITHERGELNIDFLAALPVEDARRWLLNIHGVGPKTAAIVLLFCYDMPAFPVDTHVHRVTGRLGLRPESMNANDAHTLMEKLSPPGAEGPFHLNMIRHGREVCPARAPACERCVLRDLCAHGAGVSGVGGKPQFVSRG
ncbi:MAG: endonuclease III [Chloroflexi bacterium]|nr:endonuclease III [Chloroflexota bacterium]